MRVSVFIILNLKCDIYFKNHVSNELNAYIGVFNFFVASSEEVRFGFAEFFNFEVYIVKGVVRGMIFSGVYCDFYTINLFLFMTVTERRLSISSLNRFLFSGISSMAASKAFSFISDSVQFVFLKMC